MNDWKPIESAPKDGTVIDLWCRRSWDPPLRDVRCTDVYWCTTHKCWRTVGNEHYVERTFQPPLSPIDRHIIPTHWMPLPSPPKDQT